MVNTLLILILPTSIMAYAFATKTLKPIEESNSLKEEFANEAAHELKTPIANIKMELENIKYENTIPAYKDFAESIREEADRMQKTINSLMGLVTAQGKKLSIEKVQVDKVILDVISKFKKQLKEKSIKTKVTGKNLQLDLNRDSLYNILSIFLDNAIKYSPKNSTITFNKYSKSICVGDEGVGIKNENLSNVYKRFFRETNDAVKKNSGSGLGLALAKKIANKNNFKLSVKNNTFSKGVCASLYFS